MDFTTSDGTANIHELIQASTSLKIIKTAKTKMAWLYDKDGDRKIAEKILQENDREKDGSKTPKRILFDVSLSSVNRTVNQIPFMFRKIQFKFNKDNGQ